MKFPKSSREFPSTKLVDGNSCHWCSDEDGVADEGQQNSMRDGFPNVCNRTKITVNKTPNLEDNWLGERPHQQGGYQHSINAN